MHQSKKRYIASSAFVVAMFVSNPGSAVNLVSTNIANAAGNCQVTDASYAPSVKVRALSMDNVGSGSIWLTCAPSSDKIAAGIDSLRISLHNQGSAPVTIGCTAVFGTSATSATYYPKSVGIGPGAENRIDWTAVGEGSGVLFAHPASVTCLLPAGTGITTDEVSYVVQLL